MPEPPPDASIAERLAGMPPAKRARLLDSMFREPDLRIEEEWCFWARRRTPSPNFA